MWFWKQNRSFQTNPKQLENIFVMSTSGGAVPLSAFMHFRVQHGAAVDQSPGPIPGGHISFNLAPGASLGQSHQRLKNHENDMHLPLSALASFQGTAQAFKLSLKNEPILILAALVTVYIVLGVLYESYIHPITILSTLPSAGVGALLALLICGAELDVVGIIGIILLIGIVKKNGIMMVDFRAGRERQHGKKPEEAIYEACLLRFRPIMMTTMTALLGGLPLALGTGTGSELRRPLGITIVGGLLVSQVLTLYTTPVIYLFMDRFARKPQNSEATEASLNLAAGKI
jgi:multidrug efflux pump